MNCQDSSLSNFSTFANVDGQRKHVAYDLTMQKNTVSLLEVIHRVTVFPLFPSHQTFRFGEIAFHHLDNYGCRIVR